MKVVNEMEKKEEKVLSVLVVDDDVLNQRMMQLILSREGYNVLLASNGLEAVEVVTSKTFDVILMDLQMPILDGVSASRKIREWENGGRHAYIIALTASYLPERGQELFDAGIDNYISKPFDLGHLRRILGYSQNKNKMTGEEPIAKEKFTPGVSFEVGLQKLGMSEELLRELLVEFVQDLPGKLDSLDDCYQRNEFELLSRLAHNLKGVSANLGGIQLSMQAGILEDKVDSGPSGEIGNIINKVRLAADEFLKSASQYLAR